MSRARDVSRTIDDYAEYLLSLGGDVNKIKNDFVIESEIIPVYYDQTTFNHFVTCSYTPIGDLISLAVHLPNDTLVIDGKFNQTNKKVSFLQGDSLYVGETAYIKYMRVL